MDAQTELNLLETAYQNYLGTGIVSYTVNGKSVQKVDIGWLTRRLDELRAIVYRQTNGLFQAAQNRPPE
jgi:hypothetical protein